MKKVKSIKIKHGYTAQETSTSTYLVLLLMSYLTVTLIHVVSEHSGLRRAIRDTWGASYNLPHILMPLVFLMGVSITEEVGDNQQDLIQTGNAYKFHYFSNMRMTLK